MNYRAFCGIILAALFTAAAPVLGAGAKDYKIGIILSIDKNTVTISLGKEEGVKVGNIFSVYSVTKVVKVPLAGEVSLKKEKEIGKIKIVKIDDHNGIGEILATAEGTTFEKGMTVIQTIEKITENEAPVIKSIIPDATAIEGGKSISINVTVEDREGDMFYLIWSADKGNLAIERSSRPVNRWTAPVRKCKAVVTVKVIDKWGNKTEQTLNLESTGTSGGSRQKFSKYRQLGGGMTSDGNLIFNMVKFDDGGDMFVLDRGKEGVFKHFIDLPYNPVKFSRVKEDEKEIELSDPSCFDIANRKVYICDSNNNMIRVFSLSGDFAGSLGSGTGREIGFLAEPSDIAVADDGTMYIADTGNVCIEVLNSTGSSRYRAGKTGDGPGEIRRPSCIELDADGNVYVLDTQKNSVLVFSSDMIYQYSFICEVPERSVLTDMILDRKSNRLYIIESTSGQVLAYTKRGKLLGTIGGGEQEKDWQKVEYPFSIGVSPLGQVYIGSSRVSQISRYNPEGSFSGKMDEEFFKGILDMCSNGRNIFLLEKNYQRISAVDYTGWIRNVMGGNSRKNGTIGRGLKVCADDEFLYVLDSQYYNVHKYLLNGEEVMQIGDKGSEPGKFRKPVDISLDDKGNLYVLDADLKRVSIFNRDSLYVRAVEDDPNGSVQMKYPALLTVSGNGSAIYVYDQKLYTIMKFSEAGTLESYFGSKGNDKPGEFYSVDYLGLDEAGYCVVGESRYDRLQKIDFTGPSGVPYVEFNNDTLLYKGTDLFTCDPYGRILIYDDAGQLHLMR